MTSTNMNSDFNEQKHGLDVSSNTSKNTAACVSIPKIEPDVLKSLPQELQDLHNTKIKYELQNHSLTFYPSPFLDPKQVSSNKFGSSLLVDSVSSSKRSANVSKLEAVRDWETQIVDTRGTNSFIFAALKAWAEHYPLRIKPQHLWLLVLQSVALHVDKNAETLRDKYVTHAGKKKLMLDRDGFVLGSRSNDWKGVIEEFVQQIDKYTVDDTVELFESDFSTATTAERVAGKVTIMDICKNYFSYGMQTFCGFPSVTLEGSQSDWVKLKQKCEQLLQNKVTKQFGTKWSLALLPLIDRFIAAYNGDIDGVFWNSMIKRGSTFGSGSFSFYSGWISILFPIIMGRWNNYCEPYSSSADYVKCGLEEHAWRGADINYFPLGVSSAPVEWTYYGKKIPLKFVAGFMGMSQDPESLELCPNVDWYIGHEDTSPKKKKKKKNRREYRE